MINLSSLLNRNYFVEMPTPYKFFKEYHELWQQETHFCHFQCRNCRLGFDSWGSLRKHLRKQNCETVKSCSQEKAFDSCQLHEHKSPQIPNGADENANYWTYPFLTKPDSFVERYLQNWTLITESELKQHPQILNLKPVVVIP